MRILKFNSVTIRIMRLFAYVCLILFSPSVYANGTAVKLDGAMILSESDNYRSLGDNYTYNVQITDSEDRKRVLTVYRKGKNKSLVKLISPASSAGRSLLFVNNNFWHYSASNGQSFRLKPQHQFLSGIDNFDLLGTELSNDYSVQFVTTDYTEVQLELQALDQDFSYQTVILKVDSKDYRPLQASFYSDREVYLNDGPPKKTIFYEKFREFRKEDHPTQIRIVDHENNEYETIMRITLLRKTNIPDEWFIPQYLERF